MNLNPGRLFGLFILGSSVALSHAQAALPTITFLQASNVPCKVGRPNVNSRESVTWSGQCIAGFADGSGTAQWSDNGKPTLRYEGLFTKGLLEGAGRMVGADGDRYEGDYKGGLRHGHGVYTSRTGERFEGEYVNNQRVAAAASAPSPLNAATPSADSVMVRCQGELATVAVATKEPLGLPHVDDFTFTDDGSMPGANAAMSQVVGKSNAVRLLRDALAFADKNRAPNCRLRGSMPPLVSEIVLIFKDRVPDKVAIFGKETATAMPGLLAYAEHGVGAWHLYNVEWQREKAEVVKRKQQAQEAALAQFVKKHELVLKEPKGLYTNPFAFEGNKLLLIVAFEQMQSATTGVFHLPGEGVLVVSDIPKGAFVRKGKVLLAGKVMGNTRFDGVVGGLMPVQGMVPNVKFLGAMICQDDRCLWTDEK